MSVSSIPVQTGGAAVIAAAAVKAGGTAAVLAARELPSTGAHYLQQLAMAGAAMLVAGAAVIRGGRHLELSAGNNLD